MMKHVTLLMSAIALFTLSSVAFAGPHHPHHKLEIMKEALDLTDSQSAAIGAIFESTQADAKPLREQLKTLKRSLRETMKAQPVDEASIKRLTAQAADVKAELMILKAKSRQLVQEQLSEEQAAKMQRLQQKMSKRHQRRGAHHDAEF